MARLKHYFFNNIISDLVKNKSFFHSMSVPKIIKIVLNVGFGRKLADKNIIKHVQNTLGLISGQKPIITKAKKSIAGFKIREEQPIGCKVTLRSNKMYEFLDRLICITLPRVRDFRGLSYKSFDGRGNYNFGITEQISFSEIDYKDIDKIIGINVTIVTNAKNNNDAFILLKKFNFPFKI